MGSRGEQVPNLLELSKESYTTRGEIVTEFTAAFKREILLMRYTSCHVEGRRK